MVSNGLGSVINKNDHQQVHPDDRALLAAAHDALRYAYAPYSHFRVGCALQADNGTVYSGCNVENASYGATLCAERVAVAKAVSEGCRRFTSIAIVSSGGDLTYPCGMCCQVLSEFGLGLRIILEKGETVYVYTLSELLPYAFTVEQLDGLCNSK